MGEAQGCPPPTASPRTLGLCCTRLLTASSSISAASSSSDTTMASGPPSPLGGRSPPSFFPFSKIFPFSCYGCRGSWSRPGWRPSQSPCPLLWAPPGLTVHLRGWEAVGNPFQRPVQQHGAQSRAQMSRHHALLLQAAVVLQGQDDGVGGRLAVQSRLGGVGHPWPSPLHPPRSVATLKA